MPTKLLKHVNDILVFLVCGQGVFNRLVVKNDN